MAAGAAPKLAACGWHGRGSTEIGLASSRSSQVRRCARRPWSTLLIWQCKLRVMLRRRVVAHDAARDIARDAVHDAAQDATRDGPSRA